MRKISSHYALDKHGEWIKRPVIEIDNDGCIASVRAMGDDFREEPGLEYYPGIIIPAFVKDSSTCSVTSDQLRRCIVNGVRRFVFDKNPEFNLPPRIAFLIRPLSANIVCHNPWESIRESMNSGLSLGVAILKESKECAKRVGMYPEWGSISVGARPGILLIKGIDLKTFKLTDNLSIRVLVE